MAIPAKIVEEKFIKVINAWQSLRPEKVIAGMSLAAFKAKIQPSFEARAQVVDCHNKLTAALGARKNADGVSLAAANLVVNAVKGDPEEGEDSELYEAMGYVRKSDRSSGLKRLKKAA